MKNKIQLFVGKFEEIQLKRDLGINLTFLDPPDNLRKNYNNYKDNLGYDEYIDLLKTWLQKSCRITNGPVFISFNEKYISEIEQIIRECKINLIQRLYWYFNFGQNNNKQYTSCLRPIYWLNKNIIYPENIRIPSYRQIKYNDKRAKNSGKMPNNIWEFPRVCGNFTEKRKWHNNQHPEKLIERIVLGHSKENDIIFDPFIGSGTVARVCYNNNRNCIGSDMSHYYIKMIKKEINNGK